MTNRAAHRVAAKVHGAAVRAVPGVNRPVSHNPPKVQISTICFANGASAFLAAAAMAAEAADGVRFNGR
jgi:hypothetical protein